MLIGPGEPPNAFACGDDGRACAIAGSAVASFARRRLRATPGGDVLTDEGARAPLPERAEPRRPEPRLHDSSGSGWLAVLARAGRASLADKVPLLASALAYSSFLAIPSVLLLVVGAFTLVAGPDTIRELVERLGAFMPSEAAEVIGDSLTRLERRPATGAAVAVLGFVLALWGATGAIGVYMEGLDIAYGRQDGRSFGRRRLVAAGLAGVAGLAVGLVACLLIFGPYVQRWVGDLLGVESVLGWLWWTLQWPILVLGLLVAFAVLHYYGPDVEHRRWQLVTPGAVVSVVGWLLASAGFSLYTRLFGSYDKAWGSLAAVVVTMTWLWLTGLALLVGGEVNAEVERSRRLRRGEDADPELDAPARARPRE